MPRLPRLAIEVTAPIAGLEITCNGTAVPAAMWTSSFPVDPGPQRIEATGPGKRPWRATVTAIEGTTARVTVGPIVDADATPTTAATATTTTAPAPGDGGTLRIAGIAVGAAGLVSLAVGAKFGHDARVASSDVSHATAWSAALDREVADGRTAGHRMWICYGVGGAALAAGAVLAYLGYRGQREVAPVTITIGPSSATFSLGGAF
jgi:hypothetical protein